jgi:hypothetical protein
MNEADLNNTFKYDKVVVNLNNNNSSTTNSAESSYYVDLVEPLRNVIYVKIIRASVIAVETTMEQSPLSYLTYDPIYIAINDYNRAVSYLKTNGNFNKINYFDLIPYSGTNNSHIEYSQASFDWSDPSVYILNPPEPNLRRLNIEIRDKTFKLFDTAVLTNFNLSICIYFIKNRV